MSDTKRKFIHQMQPNFDEKEAKACYDYMMSGGWVTEFRKTKEFEKLICDYTGAKYCHMVNNGTISLSLALLALGVTKNDKVIIPNMTMIASPNSVKLIGAKPVFVDVDKTGCLDIDKTEELLKNDVNKSIRVVMHVSLNTRCNDIQRLKTICTSYEVHLIEDSAQSLGSFFKGKHLGTYGDIGSFSFSSPKIISTGQGGCLITNDEALSEKIYKLKNFGRSTGGTDTHDVFGINSKFTDLQAVVGIEQMKKLPDRVKRMKEMWNLYHEMLSKHLEIEMLKPTDEDWIPWFIDIYTEDPVKLQKFLKEKSIGTRLVYPKITGQTIYKDYDTDNFPNTENYSTRGLWLPSSTVLTNEDIEYVCEHITNYFLNTSNQ